MAWVELVPIAAILLMVAWIFLRPYPSDGSASTSEQLLEQSPEKIENTHSGKEGAEGVQANSRQQSAQDQD
ncbi:MAG: hypothetical protein V7739_20885 [Motiliproteus sp.]